MLKAAVKNYNMKRQPRNELNSVIVSSGGKNSSNATAANHDLV